MFLIFVSLICTLFVITKDVVRCGYKVLLNPFFWATLLTLMYFIVPSFFVSDINYYFSWNMNSLSIMYSHVLVFIFSCTLLLLYYFMPSSGCYPKKENYTPLGFTAAHVIYGIVSIYVFVALLLSWDSGSFTNAFEYNLTQPDPYKLKNISYLMVALSIYVFWETKRFWVFVPSLVIIVLDIVHGSRTTAFIALIPMLLSILIYKKRIYIVQNITLVALIILLGVVRFDGGAGAIPWYISALGEFRETYLTLPLYIQNESFVGQGGWENIASGLGIGVLQPLRASLIDSYTFAGEFIASDIDRGYGLGANLLVESLYYGYVMAVVTIALFFIFLFAAYNLIKRLPLHHSLVFISVLVVFLRLMIREGLYSSLGLMLFVILVYCLPVYLLTKIKIKRLHGVS